MNIALPAWTLGTIIAVAVLVLCIVLIVIGHTLSAKLVLVLGLLAALAVARLT